MMDKQNIFFDKHLDKSDKVYFFLASLYIMVLVLTNIVGTKLFVIFDELLPQGLFGGKIVLTAGIITYPLTFLFTDVVSELWGKKRADLMVINGFIASILMIGILVIARSLQPADIWNVGAEYAEYFNSSLHIVDSTGTITGAKSPAAQAAYSFTFDAPGMLLIASMTAYLVAQLSDNYIFHFLRKVTKGKHLWLRNNGSTMISQLLDTMIVNSIFLNFYWGLSATIIIQVIITSYLAKVILAMLDTPLIYLGIFSIKRIFKK